MWSETPRWATLGEVYLLSQATHALQRAHPISRASACQHKKNSLAPRAQGPTVASE